MYKIHHFLYQFTFIRKGTSQIINSGHFQRYNEQCSRCIRVSLSFFVLFAYSFRRLTLRSVYRTTRLGANGRQSLFLHHIRSSPHTAAAEIQKQLWTSSPTCYAHWSAQMEVGSEPESGFKGSRRHNRFDSAASGPREAKWVCRPGVGRVFSEGPFRSARPRASGLHCGDWLPHSARTPEVDVLLLQYREVFFFGGYFCRLTLSGAVSSILARGVGKNVA